MAEYLAKKGEVWIAAYIETLEDELRKLTEAPRVALPEDVKDRRIAELEAELVQCRPKWKVCQCCMRRGLRDVGHGETAPCRECNGAKVLAVEP